MTCERCDDTGWEPITIDDVRRVRRCSCWHTAHPSTVANIPAYFATVRLSTYQARKGTDAALAAAQRWQKGSHDLYLFGPVGSGKSRLACSLANEATTTGASAAFFDVSDLVTKARAFEFDESPVDPIAQAKRVDVLVLDDLGSVEKASDYTLRVLLGLYNDRLAHRRRTIWTSNLTLDQLSVALQDDRLGSRIAGNGETVCISASDFRVDGPRAWVVNA